MRGVRGRERGGERIYLFFEAVLERDLKKKGGGGEEKKRKRN